MTGSANQNVQFKVATASLNQTIMNFTRNVPNKKAAIDEAVNDGANLLTMPELGTTGYSGDDNFKWIRDDSQQYEILEIVDELAKHAAKRDPNLVVSIGFPLFYADKSQPVQINVGTEENPAWVDNPLYNINNRPFNAQAIISHGRVQAISLKSIQPDGAAEFEPRQFASWPNYAGTHEIELPFCGKVPVGKPVVELRDKDGKRLTLFHEICAEGWPGIYDNGTINQKEVDGARYLARLAQKQDISLTINPSASKPEPYLNKPKLRENLATVGSNITGGGYVYTNSLGLEAAPTAFEGGSLFVENGKLTHRGKRYSMMDVEYASKIMTLPQPQKGTAHKVIAHDFTPHVHQEAVGGPDAFEEITDDKKRQMEEIVRNTSLWLRDYLRKTGMQGFVVSLSGGADSAFGACMITSAIELNIKQLEEKFGDRKKAVDAYIQQFPKLTYRDEVMQVNASQGPEAAIDLIKKRILTCIYLPSDNSSETTLNAARTLIEGGTVNGQSVKGIGGNFVVTNVQACVDSYIEAYCGVTHKDISGVYFTNAQGERVSLLVEVRKEIKEYVAGTRTEFSPEVHKAINRPDKVLSWNEPSDDITLQNLQARARVAVPWIYGNKEHKIACVTSNWSEAVAGYWTFAGDGHMGAINICGGVPKTVLRKTLRYLENEGLQGLEPYPSLHYVNNQQPSAELRPLKEGEIAQTDEEDMMPYKHLDAIGMAIFFEKMTPVQAYHSLIKAWDDEENRPLFSSKEELMLCIDKACKMWHASQFKRVGSVIAPFLGQNVDPHTAVRTTILSDGFQTGLAMLKLEYLNEKIGANFKTETGYDFAEVKLRAKIEEHLRTEINAAPLDQIAARMLAVSQQPVFQQQILVGGRAA